MKTEIKKLDSLSHNDTAATKLINDNFAALQKGIEDSLSRTGKTPNFMDAEFDMNSKRVINVGDPVDDTDGVNYGTYKKHIDQAVEAARSAAVSANNSQNSAVEARQYARQAKTSRDEAVAAAEEAKETVETGKEVLNGIVTDGKRDLDNIVNEGVVEISDTIDAGKEDLNKIITTGKADLDEAAGNYYTKTEVDAKIAEGGGSDVDLSNYYNKTESDGMYLRTNYYLSYKSYTYVQTVDPYPNPIQWLHPYPDDGDERGESGWFTVENMGEYKYMYVSNGHLAFKERVRYSTANVTFPLKESLSSNFAPVADLKRRQDWTATKDRYSVIIYCKEMPTESFTLTITYI